MVYACCTLLVWKNGRFGFEFQKSGRNSSESLKNCLSVTEVIWVILMNGSEETPQSFLYFFLGRSLPSMMFGEDPFFTLVTHAPPE
jgi:hypothetical protein